MTDQIGAVESVKAASDIFAPVSGLIESINESLGDQPALLNRSPEDQGALPFHAGLVAKCPMVMIS